MFFIQSHTRNQPNTKYRRGKSTEGTKALRRALNEGHLVEVHTGYEVFDSHIKHTIRLNQPNIQGGLPGDLTRCKDFINGLVGSYRTEFVRPVEGVHNADVRRAYSNADLKMTMWDVDSRDAITGQTPTTIHNNLRTGIQSKLEAGWTRLVILFHELDPDTRAEGNLASYIATIDETVRDFVLNSESDEEPENQTQFIPNWDLTASEIRTLLHDISWVAGDPDH